MESSCLILPDALQKMDKFSRLKGVQACMHDEGSPEIVGYKEQLLVAFRKFQYYTYNQSMQNPYGGL